MRELEIREPRTRPVCVWVVWVCVWLPYRRDAAMHARHQSPVARRRMVPPRPCPTGTARGQDHMHPRPAAEPLTQRTHKDKRATRGQHAERLVRLRAGTYSSQLHQRWSRFFESGSGRKTQVGPVRARPLKKVVDQKNSRFGEKLKMPTV